MAMITYLHFAFTQLRLVNGYHELDTEDGLAREYEREDELEHCIRRLVLRRPTSLRGSDLRFLRRGLEITQASFGKMVDRDAQTVARWEKSSETVPMYVDLTIRMRFAARFDNALSIKEVLSFVDGSAPPLPSAIYLTLTEKGWDFDFHHPLKTSATEAHASSVAVLPAGVPIYRIIESELITQTDFVTDKPITLFEELGSQPFSIMATALKTFITPVSTLIPPSYLQGNPDEYSRSYH